MRVGILALLQESNTFIARRAELEHFRQDVLLTGEAIVDRFGEGVHHEVAGFIAGLADARLEAVPIFAARALPYGTIAAEAWNELMRAMFGQFDLSGPCDGYLVAAHGATVAESAPDADGQWLSSLRARVGAAIPIIGTLDLHANLSPQMVAACDALVAYRTNPHVDQFDRGRDAARLMARTLHGEIRPTQAAAFPPLVISIDKQETFSAPCKQVYGHANQLLSRDGVLSNSILLGFPYADVSEMGASTLVVTVDNPKLAQQLADDLAARMWTDRERYLPKLISIEDAVQQAVKLKGPVCLLDVGDNVGGGGPADSTWIAHALNQSGVPAALMCLCDPAAVAQCEEAGTGAEVQLTVGGRSGPLHGEPLQANCTVLAFHDGKFTEPEPRHGGFSQFDQGRCAIVCTAAGLTLPITSRRMAPFSLSQITSCGIDPRRFQILVAKGVIAPVAAYRSVCKHFIRVNTPGVTTADLSTNIAAGRCIHSRWRWIGNHLLLTGLPSHERRFPLSLSHDRRSGGGASSADYGRSPRR